MSFARKVVLYFVFAIFANSGDALARRIHRHSESSEDDESLVTEIVEIDETQRVSDTSNKHEGRTIIDIRMPSVRTTKVNNISSVMKRLIVN